MFKSSVVVLLRSLRDLAPLADDRRPVICLTIPGTMVEAPLLLATTELRFVLLLLCDELDDAAVAVEASWCEESDDKTLLRSGILVDVFDVVGRMWASVLLGLSTCVVVAAFDASALFGLLKDRSPGSESSSSAKSSSE